MKKVISILIIGIMLFSLIGCSSTTYNSNISKEDAIIYDELYNFYTINKKVYFGEIEIPIKNKKLLSEYETSRDKLRQMWENNEFNETQNEIWENVWFIWTGIDPKRNADEIQQYIKNIETIYKDLKNSN